MSKYFTVNRIAILAILTSLSHVGRIAFQFIPNVQPVTVILIIITLTMGTLDGVIVAATSMLLSNMLLGMGPWTLYQIISYALVMVIIGCFRHLYQLLATKKHVRRIVFALISGLAGLLYGFIISVLSAQLYGVSNFWVYYGQGISFDLMHLSGNVAFFLVLEPILVPIIQKRISN